MQKFRHPHVGGNGKQWDTQETDFHGSSSHFVDWDRNLSLLENDFPKVKKCKKFLENRGEVSQTPHACSNYLCSSLDQNC